MAELIPSSECVRASGSSTHGRPSKSGGVVSSNPSQLVIESLQRSVRSALREDNQRELLLVLAENNNLTLSDMTNSPHTVTSLELFLLNIPRLPEVRLFPYLTVLKLMHVGLESMADVKALTRLEELWLCDNYIALIQGLERLSVLRKLYLHNNEITSLDGLPMLSELEELWLSGNRIEQVSPYLHLIPRIRILMLADNPVSHVEGGSVQTTHVLSHLTELNLAQCHIFSFVTLVYLAQLPRLRKVWLSDPLYGDNPLCRLSNYHTCAMQAMPRLCGLDHGLVSVEQRAAAAAVMHKKRVYYRMRMHRMGCEVAVMRAGCETVWQSVCAQARRAGEEVRHGVTQLQNYCAEMTLYGHSTICLGEWGEKDDRREAHGTIALSESTRHESRHSNSNSISSNLHEDNSNNNNNNNNNNRRRGKDDVRDSVAVAGTGNEATKDTLSLVHHSSQPSHAPTHTAESELNDDDNEDNNSDSETDSLLYMQSIHEGRRAAAPDSSRSDQASTSSSALTEAQSLLHRLHRCEADSVSTLRRMDAELSAAAVAVERGLRGWGERLCMELHTGGNIRLEEVSAVADRTCSSSSNNNINSNQSGWFARTEEFLRARFRAPLFYARCGVSGLRVRRVRRIVHRGLRLRFDARVKELEANVSQAAQRKKLLCLMSPIPDTPAAQEQLLHHVMLHGFDDPSPDIHALDKAGSVLPMTMTSSSPPHASSSAAPRAPSSTLSASRRPRRSLSASTSPYGSTNTNADTTQAASAQSKRNSRALCEEAQTSAAQSLGKEDTAALCAELDWALPYKPLPRHVLPASSEDAVTLVSSLWHADEERLRVCGAAATSTSTETAAAAATDATEDWCSAQVIISRVYLGKSVMALGNGEDGASSSALSSSAAAAAAHSRRAAPASTSAVCAGRRVRRKDYSASISSVYRTHASGGGGAAASASDRVWYCLDRALILPEFVVDFVYTRPAAASGGSTCSSDTATLATTAAVPVDSQCTDVYHICRPYVDFMQHWSHVSFTTESEPLRALVRAALGSGRVSLCADGEALTPQTQMRSVTSDKKKEAEEENASHAAQPAPRDKRESRRSRRREETCVVLNDAMVRDYAQRVGVRETQMGEEDDDTDSKTTLTFDIDASSVNHVTHRISSISSSSSSSSRETRPSLPHCTLSHRGITALSPHLRTVLWSSLVTLDISHNALRRLPWTVLGTCAPMLRELNVSHNALRRLGGAGRGWSGRRRWRGLSGESAGSGARVRQTATRLPDADEAAHHRTTSRRCTSSRVSTSSAHATSTSTSMHEKDGNDIEEEGEEEDENEEQEVTSSSTAMMMNNNIIITMSHLRWLDVSYNALTECSELRSVARCFPRLHTLILHHNPMMQDEPSASSLTAATATRLDDIQSDTETTAAAVLHEASDGHVWCGTGRAAERRALGYLADGALARLNEWDVRVTRKMQSSPVCSTVVSEWGARRAATLALRRFGSPTTCFNKKQKDDSNSSLSASASVVVDGTAAAMREMSETVEQWARRCTASRLCVLDACMPAARLWDAAQACLIAKGAHTATATATAAVSTAQGRGSERSATQQSLAAGSLADGEGGGYRCCCGGSRDCVWSEIESHASSREGHSHAEPCRRVQYTESLMNELHWLTELQPPPQHQHQQQQQQQQPLTPSHALRRWTSHSILPSTAPTLCYLVLRHHNLTDLAPVATLTALRVLDVQHNCLTTLPTLTALRELHTVNVSFNALGSLHRLGSLPALRCLCASGNRALTSLADSGLLERRDAVLEELYLSDTGLTDATQLYGLRHYGALLTLDLSHTRVQLPAHYDTDAHTSPHPCAAAYSPGVEEKTAGKQTKRPTLGAYPNEYNHTKTNTNNCHDNVLGKGVNVGAKDSHSAATKQPKSWIRLPQPLPPRVRHYVIYHVPSLKVVDGMSVTEEEVQRARELFAGRVSWDMLTQQTALTPRRWHTVRELSLSHCGLREVGLLEGFTALEVLRLTHNGLTRLSSSANNNNNCGGLATLTHLRALDLSHNRLTGSWTVSASSPSRLHPAGGNSDNGTTSEQQQHVVSATLSTSTVSLGDVLSHMHALESLSLESNHVSQFDELALRLPRLRFLNLKANQLQLIHHGWTQLPRLYELLLSENKIVGFHADCFLACGELTVLDASENHIRYTDGLSALTRLETLLLGANRLTDLSALLSGVQASSAVLTRVTLIGNGVARKPNYRLRTIAGLSALRELDSRAVTAEERESAEALRHMDYVVPAHVVMDMNYLDGGHSMSLGVVAAPAMGVMSNHTVAATNNNSVGVVGNSSNSNSSRVGGGVGTTTPIPSTTAPSLQSMASALTNSCTATKTMIFSRITPMPPPVMPPFVKVSAMHGNSNNNSSVSASSAGVAVTNTIPNNSNTNNTSSISSAKSGGSSSSSRAITRGVVNGGCASSRAPSKSMTQSLVRPVVLGKMQLVCRDGNSAGAAG